VPDWKNVVEIRNTYLGNIVTLSSENMAELIRLYTTDPKPQRGILITTRGAVYETEDVNAIALGLIEIVIDLHCVTQTIFGILRWMNPLFPASGMSMGTFGVPRWPPIRIFLLRLP
jgi:hypothetical protein